MKEMEDLDPDIDIDSDLLEALNNALHEYYEMKVDEEQLEAFSQA